MTNTHLATAAQNQDQTATWMRTPQAATMAQLDEQVKGQHAGLTPGEDSVEAFAAWIRHKYGELPQIPILEGLHATAQEAGRLRHWQANRLANSQLVAITGNALTVVQRLAASGSFSTTPPISDALPRSLTFVWPKDYRGYGTYSVQGPGALPGENDVCAITIDQDLHRIIEWSPTDLDFGGSTQRILDSSNATLPPWIVAGDDSYEVDDTRVEQWQARIISASAFDSSAGHCSLLEQANAALAAIYTGLVSVKKTGAGFVLDQPSR